MIPNVLLSTARGRVLRGLVRCLDGGSLGLFLCDTLGKDSAAKDEERTSWMTEMVRTRIRPSAPSGAPACGA